MVQLIYKYDKCLECGKEAFQWGMVVEHTFMCYNCIRTALDKLNDMIEGAKHLPKINEKELQRTGKTTLRSR